jgi:hypothetical protein
MNDDVFPISIPEGAALAESPIINGVIRIRITNMLVSLLNSVLKIRSTCL